jgi:hypothetical protein
VTRVLAYFMSVVALVAIAVASWQANYVDKLRDDYLKRNGTIEVFEAIYFDSKAASVIGPALLAFILCQLMAVVFFVRSQTPSSWLSVLSFWALWIVAWVSCALYGFQVAHS